MRQIVKPLIEMLAAIPSVAYGFFALVVFAPLLQNSGGIVLSVGTWMILGPVAILAAVLLSEFIAKFFQNKFKDVTYFRISILILFIVSFLFGIFLNQI